MCVYLHPMNKSWIIIVSIFACLTISCLEDPACEEDKGDVVLFSFFKKSDSSSLTLSVDSIYIQGFMRNAYKNASMSSGQIVLPPELTSLKLIIKADTLEGSLDLNYQPYPKLYSTKCNIQLLFINHNITSHSFDSIATHFEKEPYSFEIYF